MLGQQGAVLQADPGTQAMIRHHALLYRDLATRSNCCAGPQGTNRLSRYWSLCRCAACAAERGTETQEYSELMAASQRFVADEVIPSSGSQSTAKLLDVGGGHGAFLRRVGAVAPDLQLGLFDLPEVVEAARDPLAADVGADRLSVFPGNFFRGLHSPQVMTSCRWCAFCTITTMSRPWRCSRTSAPASRPALAC